MILLPIGTFNTYIIKLKSLWYKHAKLLTLHFNYKNLKEYVCNKIFSP